MRERGERVHVRAAVEHGDEPFCCFFGCKLLLLLLFWGGMKGQQHNKTQRNSTTTNLSRLMRTASTEDEKCRSWIGAPVLVLSTVRRRGVSAGCSPAPT